MVDPATDPKASSHLSLALRAALSRGLWLLLIVGLCIVNGLLIKQNRDLKAVIARVGKQSELLEPGEAVKPFAANTLSGERQVVNYADRAKTVLLAFSPQCAACESSIPYWRAIKAACARNQYQIWGISLADGPKTSAFLMSKGLSLEAFVDIEAETREAYKLWLTPLTIVIDNNGKVERIWPGAFSRESKRDVESYFGISVADDVK